MLVESTNQLATYLVRGSAAVQVSGSSTLKTVASLQLGQRILSIDMARFDLEHALIWNALIWNTLQHIEVVPKTSMLQNTIIVGFGGGESLSLQADQVVLARSKTRLSMKLVRTLKIGVDSLVLFGTDGLQWRFKNPREIKKVQSLQLLREKDSSEVLYKLTVGSTHHSLLMACAIDAKHFSVVDCSNSTLDLKAQAQCKVVTEASESPKMEIKNTFIDLQSQVETEALHWMREGRPRSNSETDIQKLASLNANDEMSEVSSNVTSKSRASSFSLKSEVSSMSGGSVTEVRLGTQAVMSEDGTLTSESTDVIHAADYYKLPVDDFGVRLSAASVYHQRGRKKQCRKCAFHNIASFQKGKLCRYGALCDFCHGPHQRFVHRK